MTKRILAVVLALAMCLSLLSVNVFADTAWGTPTLTYDESAKTMTVTWGAHEDATAYAVTLYRDGTPVSSRNVAKTAETKAVFTGITAGGNYKARVEATRSGDTSLIAESTAVTVASSVSSGSVSIKSTSTGATVTWKEVNGAVGYIVDYTYYDADSKTNKSNSIQVANTSTSCDIAVAYSNLRTVTVSYQNASYNKVTIASINVSAGTSSGNNSGYGTGSVGLAGTTLYWNSTSPTGYSVVYYVGTSTTANYINSNRGYVSTNSVDVSSILSRYGTYYSITFQVTAYGTNNVIGTYYYPASSSAAATGSFVVTPSYTGTASASWSSYVGADRYLIIASVDGATTYAQTAFTTSVSDITYTYGRVTTIVVYAYNGNTLLATIGTATINAQGQVTYSGTNSNTPNNSWTNTVTGNNCTLTVGASSSTIQWNTTVPGPYSVLVIPSTGNVLNNNVGNVNYYTIPYGSNTSFQVLVYTTNTNNTVASVNYTASTSSANNSNIKSSIKDLTVSNSATNSTTITWDAVSGALYYELEFAPLNAANYTTDTTRTTSYTLPYGKNIGFEAYVYACKSTTRTLVGSIVHVAGDEFTTSSSSDKKDDNKTDTTKPADTTPAYVTGFKGTVGTSGSITLAWNAASGKPTYEVYYKKTSDSTWKKLYSTTARSLKVNGLKDGTSYDFKVVANSRDSGTLTMTIGTTSSTKTATDPGSTSSASAPSMSSASGGSGSITASWTSVSGANLYRVYIAEDGSTTYKTKKTAWSTSGTSITLTGVDKGTYKIRVKASTDNGKTWTDLADCDYLTVTVK